MRAGVFFRGHPPPGLGVCPSGAVTCGGHNWEGAQLFGVCLD